MVVRIGLVESKRHHRIGFLNVEADIEDATVAGIKQPHSIAVLLDIHVGIGFSVNCHHISHELWAPVRELSAWPSIRIIKASVQVEFSISNRQKYIMAAVKYLAQHRFWIVNE